MRNHFDPLDCLKCNLPLVYRPFPCTIFSIVYKRGGASTISGQQIIFLATFNDLKCCVRDQQHCIFHMQCCIFWKVLHGNYSTCICLIFAHTNALNWNMALCMERLKSVIKGSSYVVNTVHQYKLTCILTTQLWNINTYNSLITLAIHTRLCE